MSNSNEVVQIIMSAYYTSIATGYMVKNRDPYQFILYLPFGESMASQKISNGWSTIYKFNAKQLDLETSLYYFGARYGVYPDRSVGNPRISLWYGVDPMTEKYPDKTLYQFCSNNAINRVDPLGLTDYELNGDGKISKVNGTDTKDGMDRLIHGTAKYKKDGTLKGREGSKYISVEKGVFDKMESNDQYQHFKTNSGEKSDQIFDFISNNVSVAYAKADIVTGEGKNESHFFTTYSNRRVDIFNDFLSAKKSQEPGMMLLSHIHSHPMTGDANMVPSSSPPLGDKGVAAALKDIFKEQKAMPKFYIWKFGIRSEYNENGKIK